MPQPPEDERQITGAAETPREIPRPAASGRKWIIYLVMFVLGLPVFFVMLAPPFVGGWILWHQITLYSQDERWHEFSLFHLATRTAEPDLAARLRWPSLAECGQSSATGASGNAGRLSSERSTPPPCPQLGPWQSWLLHPAVYPEWHRRVSGVLRLVPVSSLLFLFGLVLSYLLRLFGADWRFRSAAPAPVPASSSTASGRISSHPPGSGAAGELTRSEGDRLPE